MERRLAAILAADVAGYSRLMGVDETGTLKALKGHRRELIDRKVTEHNGHIVKLMGDGMLIEFNSVVDAVAYAVAVQLEMARRNRLIARDKAVSFRIGINIGDVIVEEGDIFGEGVNVAARLEALSEPGGICLGRNVRDEIRNKLDLTLKDMGEIEVKNIARPVRAFHVVLDAKAEAIAQPGEPAPAAPVSAPWPRHAAAAAALLGAVMFGGWAWSFTARTDPAAALEDKVTDRIADVVASKAWEHLVEKYAAEHPERALVVGTLPEPDPSCRSGEYVSSLDVLPNTRPPF